MKRKKKKNPSVKETYNKALLRSKKGSMEEVSGRKREPRPKKTD